MKPAPPVTRMRTGGGYRGRWPRRRARRRRRRTSERGAEPRGVLARTRSRVHGLLARLEGDRPALTPAQLAARQRWQNRWTLPIIVAAVLPLFTAGDVNVWVELVVGVGSWLIFLVDMIVQRRIAPDYLRRPLGWFDLAILRADVPVLPDPRRGQRHGLPRDRPLRPCDPGAGRHRGAAAVRGAARQGGGGGRRGRGGRFRGRLPRRAPRQRPLRHVRRLPLVGRRHAHDRRLRRHLPDHDDGALRGHGHHVHGRGRARHPRGLARLAVRRDRAGADRPAGTRRSRPSTSCGRSSWRCRPTCALPTPGWRPCSRATGPGRPPATDGRATAGRSWDAPTVPSGPCTVPASPSSRPCSCSRARGRQRPPSASASASRPPPPRAPS